MRIVKVAKSYAFGKLEELLFPSPDRIEPDCPCFSQCGGCCYRHITYEAELRIKEARVRDALQRIGGFDKLPLRPILGGNSRDGYRNKALLPLGTKKDGSLAMGFYAVNSHRIVDCSCCRLQPEEFHRAMDAFREWAAAYGIPCTTRQPIPERCAASTCGKGRKRPGPGLCGGQRQWAAPRGGAGGGVLNRAVPGLASVVVNSNRERTNVALGKRCRTIYGSDTIEDVLCGLTFQLSPLSFYQVNRTQAQRLYELAGRYAQLTGKELLLDLYCGAGTIGLSMARQARRLIGVEIVPEAVENARQNAAVNHIENGEFFCGDAAESREDAGGPGRAPGRHCAGPSPKGLLPGPGANGGGIWSGEDCVRLLRPGTPGPGFEALRPAGVSPRGGCAGGYVPGNGPCGDGGAAGTSRTE